jgi:LytS/YehU family sensor histidine kinase
MQDAAAMKLEAAALLRRAGRWVVAAFWVIQFLELSVVAFIEGHWFVLHVLPERVIVVAAGMLSTLAFVEFVARLEGRPFRVRLLATFGAALLICAGLMVFAYQLSLLPVWGRGEPDMVGFVYTGFAWSWFFLSIAAALVALSYSFEVRERGERLADLETIARDARLSALRHQLNPHFLFNTLNSVVGLIGRGHHREAEEMVENLADFLRTTLELDPAGDVELRREAELQELYLAVEQVRFPNRLRRDIDIPADLTDVLVPALITQPLVENTIRHSVARSTGLVTLRMGASARDGWLTLVVEDDGGAPAGGRSTGTGNGLRIVRERLAAQFGGEHSVCAVKLERGFRTELRLPLRRA